MKKTSTRFLATVQEGQRCLEGDLLWLRRGDQVTQVVVSHAMMCPNEPETHQTEFGVWGLGPLCTTPSIPSVFKPVCHSVSWFLSALSANLFVTLFRGLHALMSPVTMGPREALFSSFLTLSLYLHLGESSDDDMPLGARQKKKQAKENKKGDAPCHDEPEAEERAGPGEKSR